MGMLYLLGVLSSTAVGARCQEPHGECGVQLEELLRVREGGLEVMLGGREKRARKICLLKLLGGTCLACHSPVHASANATVDWQPAWAESSKPPLSVCLQTQVGHGASGTIDSVIRGWI